MPNVSAILRRKGREVVTARPDMTVLEAAQLMNTHRIGCVVVTNSPDSGHIVGILTERDILTRLVAEEREPRGTLVRDIMTPQVLTCEHCTDSQELRALMQCNRVRHVPVLDGGQLSGLVSIGDVNALEAEGLSATIVAMEEYITRG